MKSRCPSRACSFACALVALAWAERAHAVTSAELYTSESYLYGRFEARIRFAPGSGVVSSFFLWKDGSELAGTYWNELDFEKLNATCRLETNAFYGDPAKVNPRPASLSGDLCGAYHTYAYEWTPDYIAWFVDDMEIRRETGEVASAFTENAASGMQLRFNIWPGDASFGGTFDPSILPVYQYIDWIQHSSYADGTFELEWREDFDAGRIPAGWSLGGWASPKGLSTHSAQNVGVVDGYAVLALTADDAVGIEGAAPEAPPEPSDTNDGDTGSRRDSGCSCRLAASEVGSGVRASLLLGALVLLRSRRRRRFPILRRFSAHG
jgi:endo-1,3-1,4-beta-glycanase ExoK